jgi:putative endonuclease
MPNTYYVYILASKRNGTLYIGVTNDLARRLCEHRDGLLPGFTKKYRVATLVYYETFDDISAAIRRESQMKKYKREWKLNLIQRDNEECNVVALSLLQPAITWMARTPAGHDGRGVHARATSWSMTFFSPALSNSTVSLLPSTVRTRP